MKKAYWIARFRVGAGINELVIVEGVDDAKQE
jgi:microcompartment protein CcmK/EutM